MSRSIYDLDIPSYWDMQTIVNAINAARDANSKHDAIELAFSVLYRPEAKVALAGLKLAEGIAETLFNESNIETKIIQKS